MTHNTGAARQRRFIPSLEGVRGYAFLLVFFMHYFARSDFPFENSPWTYPIFLLRQTAWVTVPVFFVLSGYLICGILCDTREREGYFKVFYSRRILRVFPVFYLTLLAVAVVDAHDRLPLGHVFWSHFFYIHNLLPGYKGGGHWAAEGQITHLWSMAVEEQFYLVMPLLVWICPNRRVLLRLVLGMIAACFAVRFGAPWLGVTSRQMDFWTPTRVDAILMGAALAIVARDPIYKRMEPCAKYVSIAGLAAIAAISIRTAGAPPSTEILSAILISVLNITAAALVISVLKADSLPSRLCSQSWICWLGSRSYGLYLFHYTYMNWFLTSFAGRLSTHMSRQPALLLSIGAAFSLTLVLAILSYRFIEQPAMDLKKRIAYGPVKQREWIPQPVFVALAEGD